jgi:uncharacterized protein
VAPSVPEPVPIFVTGAISVSGLWQCAPESKACLVLAHGAGAGMHHPFLAGVANELEGLGIATLRYQFPYMEHHGKRPDPPALCHATVRAAVAAALRLSPSLPLFAGGKSFGGRMTSQAQSASPLVDVRGLVFLGFPLHPPKQPSETRAQHLFEVKIPLLFLQGTRDTFAELPLLRPLVTRLGGDIDADSRCRPLLPRAGSNRPYRRAGANRNVARPLFLDGFIDVDGAPRNIGPKRNLRRADRQMPVG